MNNIFGAILNNVVPLDSFYLVLSKQTHLYFIKTNEICALDPILRMSTSVLCVTIWYKMDSETKFIIEQNKSNWPSVLAIIHMDRFLNTATFPLNKLGASTDLLAYVHSEGEPNAVQNDLLAKCGALYNKQYQSLSIKDLLMVLTFAKLDFISRKYNPHILHREAANAESAMEPSFLSRLYKGSLATLPIELIHHIISFFHIYEKPTLLMISAPHKV